MKLFTEGVDAAAERVSMLDQVLRAAERFLRPVKADASITHTTSIRITVSECK